MSTEIKNLRLKPIPGPAATLQGRTKAENDGELVLARHRPIIVGGGWKTLLRTFAFSANGQFYS